MRDREKQRALRPRYATIYYALPRCLRGARCQAISILGKSKAPLHHENKGVRLLPNRRVNGQAKSDWRGQGIGCLRNFLFWVWMLGLVRSRAAGVEHMQTKPIREVAVDRN